jgi:hypothetical protein
MFIYGPPFSHRRRSAAVPADFFRFYSLSFGQAYHDFLVAFCRNKKPPGVIAQYNSRCINGGTAASQ